MKTAFGIKTDVGQVRDGNEDSFLVEAPLFAVADGMGGHLGGEVASQTTIGIIEDRVHSADARDGESLAAVLREANSAIRRKAEGDSSLEGMGTTCTLVSITDHNADIVHVGDSRAYLFRDGEMKQLTEDHTLVARMVQQGRIRPEDAEHHPQRSIITRALGVDSDVELDVQKLELADGDRLLLCSDGLTSMAPTAAIREVLAAEGDPQAAADRLVDLANQEGGEDNVTVVVVDVTEGAPGKRPPPPPPRTHGAAVKAQSDRDTGELDPIDEPPEPSGGRRSNTMAKLVVGIVILGLVTVGGYFGANYMLDNSFFVGLNEDQIVTIYRGIPEEIAGLSLKEELRATTLSWDDLPTQNLKSNVREGIKATSLEAAQQTVADLQDRAREFSQTKKRSATGETGKDAPDDGQGGG